MGRLVGVNIDPGHYNPSDWPEVARNLYDHGVSIARTVLKESLDPKWQRDLARCGVWLGGILTTESGDFWGITDPHMMRLRALEVAENYSIWWNCETMAFLQCGNEPDIVSPASWTLEPKLMNALIQGTRDGVGPAVTLIGPGLASGPDSAKAYLDQLLAQGSQLDGIGLHLYATLPNATFTPDPYGHGHVEQAISQFTGYNLPIYVTEWGSAKGEMPEEDRAEYFYEMVRAMKHIPEIWTNCAFVWDTMMVPEHGILDHGEETLVSKYFSFAALT